MNGNDPLAPTNALITLLPGNCSSRRGKGKSEKGETPKELKEAKEPEALKISKAAEETKEGLSPLCPISSVKRS